MQSMHLLVVDPTTSPQTILAQGVILRQVNKDGTHFLCKTFKKGYGINQVVSLEKLENCLLFDSIQDLQAFVEENNPKPKALEAPLAVEPPPPEYAPRPSRSNLGLVSPLPTAAPAPVAEPDQLPPI